MIRIRRKGRAAAVATVSAATLLVGAGAAVAVTSTSGSGPAAAAVEATTSDTCLFPVQKLEITINLRLRSAADNDIKRIKVRATNKNETGTFYRKGVVLKSIKISTEQVDLDAISVGVYKRYTSPAYVTLDPKTNGSEVTKLTAVGKFEMPSGTTATATCAVRVHDV